MKIVIGNYDSPEDNRNLILNEKVVDYLTGTEISPLMACITSISGLESPAYRNGTGNWSGTDGGYLATQFYGARTIVIAGTYIDKKANCSYENETSSQFDNLARLYIRSRLPIRKEQLIRIFMDNGMTFFTKGYCTALNMEYHYSGYGDFQITMYCPDPALYRGSRNGGINTEWNSGVLYKTQDVGFDSSWVDGSGVHYATMEKINNANKGIVWRTGGRSSAVIYDGDMPGYPRIVAELQAGEHLVNPSFYSVTEDKTFSLGYPQSSVAVFKISSVNNGAVTGVTITSAGAYDADYSANGVQMQNYGTNNGSGCTLNITMTQGQDGLYSVTSVTVKSGGTGYAVNDTVTPLIAGAAIFQLPAGAKLVIDMAEHTVMTYSGVNYNSAQSCSYYITAGSEWFSLTPMTTNNIIFVSANDATDVKSVSIEWRNGYAGI